MSRQPKTYPASVIYLAIFTALLGSHSQSKDGLHFPNLVNFRNFPPKIVGNFTHVKEKHARIQNVLSEGVQLFFSLMREERIHIPL